MPTSTPGPIPHPTWYANIQGMFNPHDISCMSFMFDLGKYSDVKANAQGIYTQVESGNMPLGGPKWTSDMVGTFQNWINDGCPEGTPTTTTISTTTTGAIPNPTWYGNIAALFTQPDIQCMLGQGVDLASYDNVRRLGSNIYQMLSTQQMPPGAPWPADNIQTFQNWMDNGYPQGTPTLHASAAKAAAFTESPTLRHRKEVTALLPDEIALLATAFQGIIAKDPKNPGDPIDPYCYFALSSIHWYPIGNTYCMHHVPGYLSWHRAYMLRFEDALRMIPGCEKVTLPYWDITSTTFPDLFNQPPFNVYTYPLDVYVSPDPSINPSFLKGQQTSRFPVATILANLQSSGVPTSIANAFGKTDWDGYNGGWGDDATYNTIITAHDNGHNSIGDTMQDPDVAAFDPIFWFFHCNWDRLFWQWQLQMGATDVDGLICTMSQDNDPLSYQLYRDPAVGDLSPFTVNAVQSVNSVTSLDVAYDNLIVAAPAQMQPQRIVRASASQHIQVDTKRVNVTVKGINRLKIPGCFHVQLLNEDKVIASSYFFQPTTVDQCPTCVQNPMARFDFELPLEAVSTGKLTVKVIPMRSATPGVAIPHDQIGNPTLEAHFLLTEH